MFQAFQGCRIEKKPHLCHCLSDSTWLVPYPMWNCFFLLILSNIVDIEPDNWWIPACSLFDGLIKIQILEYMQIIQIRGPKFMSGGWTESNVQCGDELNHRRGSPFSSGCYLFFLDVIILLAKVSRLVRLGCILLDRGWEPITDLKRKVSRLIIIIFGMH